MFLQKEALYQNISTLAHLFWNKDKDIYVHLSILSQVSLMYKEATITMSEVPFLVNHTKHI